MGETVKNKDADKAEDAKSQDKALDRELKDSFPASDPPSSTQRDDKSDKPASRHEG